MMAVSHMLNLAREKSLRQHVVNKEELESIVTREWLFLRE